MKKEVFQTKEIHHVLYAIFGHTMANWTASIFHILFFHIVKKKYPSSMHISNMYINNLRRIRDPNLKTVERLIRKEVYHFGSLP